MMKLFLLLLFVFSQQVYAGLVVVVSKDSTVDVLQQEQVENIFLSKTNRFPNGDKAIPIEIRGDQSRIGFYQKIADKTPTQLSAYWTTLVFSGRGKPPKGLKDLPSLITRLEQTNGTISYLDESQITPNLKVIYRFP